MGRKAAASSRREGKKADPGRHWREVRGIQGKMRKQESWKGWMAPPSQDAERSRAWESEELSVMAPGRSEPGEGRAQSSASHKERVTGHSPMEDGKADMEVEQQRTFLNASEVGGIQVP